MMTTKKKYLLKNGEWNEKRAKRKKKEFRNLKTHQHRKTTSNIAMMQKKAHNIAQCAGNIHANKWSISRKKKKKT